MESSGGQLEFSALLGDLWSSLELQEVEYTSGGEPDEITRIEADAILIEYSLLELLTDGLGGLHAVSSRKLSGHVRVSSATSSEPSSPEPFALPAVLPRFDIQVEELRLTLPELEPIELHGLTLLSDATAPTEHTLEIARVLHEDRALAIRGDFSYAEGRLQLKPLELGTAATLTGFIEVSESEAVWDFVATLGEGRLSSRGNTEPGLREVELDATQLSLRDLAALGRSPTEQDARGSLDCSLRASDDGTSPWPAFAGDLEVSAVRAFGFELESLTASLELDEESPKSWRKLQGTASLDATGLGVPGARLESLSAQLRFDGTRLRLDRFVSTSDFHELLASGELFIDGPEFTLRVDELSVSQDDVGLALNEPTTLFLRDGAVAALSVFDLRGSAGRMQVRFDPATGDCVQVVIDKLNSGGLLASLSDSLPEFEDLTGTARACRSLSGWTQITTDLVAKRLTFAAAEFDCKVRLLGDWTEKRATLHELRFEHDGVPFLEASGAFGLEPTGVRGDDPMSLSLKAHVERARDHIPPRWRDSIPAEGDLQLTASIEGTPNVPRGLLEATASNFALHGRSDPTRTFLSPTELSIRMRLAESLVLEDLVWTGTERHQVRADATLETGPDIRWFDAGVVERLQAAKLTCSGSVVTERLDEAFDWLRDWFGVNSSLRSGHVEGQFAVGGTLSEPVPTAHLRLEGGTVRTGGIPPMTALALACDVNGREVKLSSVRGELGAAPFRGNATMNFPRESSPHVTAHLEGDDLLLLRNSSTKVRADLSLDLKGPLDKLLLSGDLTLAQGRLVSPLDILDFNLRGEKPVRREGLHLFRLTESPFKELRFDVNVRSRGAFRIDNNVASGAVRPDLRLGGTGEVPTLAGTLYVDTTRVKLPANDITVRTGVLRFDETDPFFPRLEIKGDARIKGYDVDITVLGPYDKPEVHLSSTPPLQHEDLVLLVLAGQLPGTSAARTSRAAAQSVAVYLAKDYLARWLSSTSPEDDSSWVDRFDLQTGRDITRSGAETLEASFRFDEDRFRKNDALYLTAESDQYDFINFGVRIVFRFP